MSLFYSSKSEEVEKLEKEFAGKAFAFKADLRDEKQIETAFKDCREKNGPFNVLVLSHGVFPSEEKPIWEMQVEQWNNTISINLTGTFLCCREFMRVLKRELQEKTIHSSQFVSIVVVGSTAGKIGFLSFSFCSSFSTNL